MKRTGVISIFRFAAAMAVFLTGIVTARADESHDVWLNMMGDRITVRAQRAPLSLLLQQFRYWDVDVDFIPDPDPLLSIKLDDVDAENALAQILGPYDYLLRWRVIPGPLGSMPKLKSIRVIRPAGMPDPKRAQANGTTPYSGPPVVNYPASAGGGLVIRDEILLRVEPGVAPSEFERLLAQINGGIVDGCSRAGVYRIRLRQHANVPDMVAQLNLHPIVNRVEPHWAWRLPGGQTAVHTADMIFDAGEAIPAGNGSRVAVLDTGISKTAPWHEFVRIMLAAEAYAGSGDDIVGHGTRMSGLAGGFLQPLGVEWNDGDQSGKPEVISIKVFDDQGVTSLFRVLQGIGQAVDNGAKVISLSWGGPQNSRLLEDALVRARLKGVPTMAAAGNEPRSQAVYPAAFPAVLAVGALRPDGLPWEKSAYGEFINLAAPGFAAGLPEDETLGPAAGTSVATAYAAGVFARYQALHAGRSAEENMAHFLNALTPPARDEKEAEPFPNAGRLDNDALRRLFED